MAFAFDQRHRYISGKVVEAFGLDTTQVEDFVAGEKQLGLINQFLQPDGPQKILFYHQAKGDDLNPEAKKELFLTTGDNERLTGKAVYFSRATGSKAVNAATVDTDLVYGELLGAPLENLHVLLSDLYFPLLRQQEGWARASEDTTKEFLTGVHKFVETLTEAVTSLQGGIELRKPDKKYDVENKQAAFNRAASDPELVGHFEMVLEDWCRQVERVLAESEQTRKEPEDVGPDSELEYWRNRMAKFNSLTEQLKEKDAKIVIGVLTAAKSKHIKRWKLLDNQITDAANEAKDNVKYLTTLEKYTEPLYTGTPTTILDILPGLMNNVKMMHTIARYYNTTERMTTLFVKITNQMITNCKQCITGPGRLWDQDSNKLIVNLESCIRLNEAYQEQYRITKDKLLAQPKGKQFDFSENQIFGKFELFCKRVQKLIDMFSTIQQFSSLAQHSVEGMDALIKNFFTIVDDFKKKPYDLLDYTKNQFDRDYLEFNMNIHELETALQGFINSSFENITSTEHALSLLKKFQSILLRENLKADLDSKYMVIFHNYGLDLETVQKIYEKHKHNPPMVRNAPPVAGNIIWSRQLLRRIEEPMKKFQTNKNIMTTKESKKIIRTYNRVARALIEFETLWHYAWCRSIETAKAGLQATLIIRHPDNGKLYVNFDREILQLIHETKCLQRMGVEVPEVAKMVLLQEEKFKSYYNQLQFVLKEYDRVLSKVPWVLSPLLKAHLQDLERKIQPGMTTLTWTSMNIDAYLHRIHHGLSKLEDLVSKINDILENRVETNLKSISKRTLVDLPPDQSFTVESFVSSQLKHMEQQTTFMDQKNLEVERAVGDLISMICNYPIDSGDMGSSIVADEDIQKLRDYYSRLMFQAILQATKASFTVLKKRLGSRSSGGFLYVERPFFDVNVELSIPNVSMNPSLDDIQASINRTAIAILRASKKLYAWGEKRDRDAAAGTHASFFNLVAKDKEVVKVVLLLTGSIEGTKKQVFEYLESFRKYDFLWKEDMQASYQEFMKKNPSLEDFEAELKKYMDVEQEIANITPVHNIGALSLETAALKNSLRAEATAWKAQYAKNLHSQAKEDLEAFMEYIKETQMKLGRQIQDLEDVRIVMGILKEVRERESEIDMQVGPIEEMYQLLHKYEVRVPKEEVDMVSDLRYAWKKLRKQAADVSETLSQLQAGFKRDLVKSVKVFVTDVILFRNDYDANGPMVAGLAPNDAMERLRKFMALYEQRERKWETYSAGEELFGLPVTEYPELKKTKKELDLLDKLYSLYDRVITVIGGYSDILWVDVVANIDAMASQVNEFQNSCKKMPKALREWDAYKELKKTIDDFLESLPLLQQLSNKAMRPRHWQQLMQITGKTLRMDPEFLRLSHLMEANLLANREDIEELCNAAVKELGIETKLKTIVDDWADQQLTFANFKNRGPVLLKGQETGEIIEKLEESSMALGSMASNRYVAPFKEEVTKWNTMLSTISEILEQWVIVQNMWVYMEAVFASGDIAKQLPQEAKRFAQIDKNYMKIMNKAFETRNVIQMCFGNDLLKSLLPHLTEQLELCQKSLTGYLEAKRNLFPRFYFVSDTVLLEILSQGSEPQAIQQHLQSVFDSLCSVTFDRVDRNKMTAMQSSEGENVNLSAAVNAVGNIEDWLTKLEKEMQRTMKDIVRNSTEDINGSMPLEEFIAKYPAQVALLGIQLQWTQDCQEALVRSRSDKQIMQATLKKISGILAELSTMTTRDLTKLDRTKIETLITIQVHQRDSFDDLVRLKVKDPLDFEWQKQCRFYWKEDVDNCIISIADVDFEYCYEYLGCKERLVITPLTDRCYITLAQAIGMYLGGAPAGPAGTGKTETTKDLGRTLGKFVVVFNCSDQMDYRAMGKILKGLAQSGCWGCFDEFNRIELEVLSVVAQQVACILTGMRERRDNIVFTDGQVITLDPKCSFFITMNPGYAGRQELPENLKVLFRGVTMMVPNRQIIMKVKLAACGFLENAPLSKKFFVLYGLCEQQLSKQPHYDFGLRNILAVLRTAGATKRANPDKSETVLLMRTLRDMNLSKFVAEDVPLFLSLINDLFPGITVDKARYMEVERAIENQIREASLQQHKDWINKVVQFYEMCLVRHGLMLVGAAGSGKSRCLDILAKALTETGVPHKELRMNPKAITAPQMFGRLDVISNDWTDGIFAALWRKASKTKNNNTWIILDGPVDAVWIENLNTVLDDNKLLTLANGDRIPMSNLMKLMFEVENLNNASPATVSRAGIIYISESELGWKPPVESWLATRRPPEAQLLRAFFEKYVDEMLRFMALELKPMMLVTQITSAMTIVNLLTGILEDSVNSNEVYPEAHLERIFIYCLIWGIGGLLEIKDRIKFDAHLRTLTQNVPKLTDSLTVFEHVVSLEGAGEWVTWQSKIPEWTYPTGYDPQFSTLFVPTMDSTRYEYLVDTIAKQRKPVLFIGGPGTAKTSVILQYISRQDSEQFLQKKINFSSATTPLLFQRTIESAVEKRQGRTFGPPSGKKMFVFLDDMSMPDINEWGDQVTAEIVRQLMDQEGFYNLEKPGEFKNIVDIQLFGAMNHPGGGKNDIPNRLKRQFNNFNMTLPSRQSIDTVFGSIIRGRFKTGNFSARIIEVSNMLTDITITLWERVAAKMLPTPAKFHYLFNMRDLSRVFQGISVCPRNIIQNETVVVGLWKHECERVFADRFIDHADKNWFEAEINKLATDRFGKEITEKIVKSPMYFVDFLEDPYENPETGEVMAAPKIYRYVESLPQLRERVNGFMSQYNEEAKIGKLDLVLFEDALKHLMRISRIIRMDRGSALLVGVGGSGKQSLTRLASYIAGYQTFQITITKSYNTNNLYDDLRALFRTTGVTGKPIAFIFTDAEVKEEGFLEYINLVLSTGEVPNLFQKDEVDGIVNDLRTVVKNAQKKGEFPGFIDTSENLYKLFVDRVRDNLHLVLCFSPVGQKFRVRARKFPGLISGCTIDWFLPWPEAALKDVASRFIGDFAIECTPQVKEQLIQHMAGVHNTVTEATQEYFQRFRRHVYVTPKSYLSFISTFRQVYEQKLKEISKLANNIDTGLRKLLEASETVAVMKVDLQKKEVDLADAQKRSAVLLQEIGVSTTKAEKKKMEVQATANLLAEQAARIAEEKAEAQKDLAAAEPALRDAEQALKGITPKDIQLLKTMKNPPDLIKRIFDGVLVLFYAEIVPTKMVEFKGRLQVLDSYPISLKVMADTQFLVKLLEFRRDDINDETIELLQPYLEMEDFNFEAAKKSAGAVAGLCKWVAAMVEYTRCRKIVGPKLESVRIAEAKLKAANAKLHAAQLDLDACERELDAMRQTFEAALSEKQRLQEEADLTKRKMEMATSLINGLAGEKIRWTQQSKEFANTIKRLVGDVALACAFVSYVGPFNQEFREMLLSKRFYTDCKARNIPVTEGLSVTKFLVDEGTIGEWNLQGLPTDELSIQNGIMVTRSTRWPILIDPQGQGLQWIKNREEKNQLRVSQLSDKNFRMHLEDCMAYGKPLLIENIEEEIDPVLDPVLEKAIQKSGRGFKIALADKECEYVETFMLIMTTKLPNPHFSPELSAKTTIIDFTVTIKGLEDQLLGRVVQREKAELEEQRQKLLEEVNSNVKKIKQLEDDLLFRLSSSSGNLLDDTSLLEVLGNTKKTAAEVQEKLANSSETEKKIVVAREEYRPVATRGSILYFLISEMAQVNVMYQTSLVQFLGLFDLSIARSEKAPLPSKRIQNIIEYLSYATYCYITRGLFERHKIMFALLMALKVQMKTGDISSDDFNAFLKGGAALDIKSARKKPFEWLSDSAWLNCIALSSIAVFRDLPDSLYRGDSQWKAWYDLETPETGKIPDYEDRLNKFQRMLIVRSLREDRTLLAAQDYITDAIGRRYVDPIPLSFEATWEESTCRTPFVCLLSPGADPTNSILELAKKKKKHCPAISMGQGQEIQARKLITTAVQQGNWVLLQNCHLGLNYLVELEQTLRKMEEIEPEFRLWITSEPHPRFPIGLLQMSIKITNEAPAGIRAGLKRSYLWVNQDMLDTVSRPEWRQMLYTTCFLHSVVQERRKFGPLGWNIPYEFNQSDLSACVSFIKNHLFMCEAKKLPISWTTVRYMVSEIQYGGRITDDFDRRLFNTYAETYLNPRIFDPNFVFYPGYRIPNSTDIAKYRAEIDALALIDNPEIFGMHANADLTFRTKESTETIATIIETQPKTGGATGGLTREEIVLKIAEDLLAKMPADYNKEEVKEKIKKQGGPKPLNIFLGQEIDRLQKAIGITRRMLLDLKLAIAGTIVMSAQLQDCLDSLYDARVPSAWLKVSWPSPTVGLWFDGFLRRAEQLTSWITNGRPPCYWLTGFFNPQGFLTAVKQEVTRKHNGWALDDVVFSTDIMKLEKEECKQGPDEGVYIYGLFLDGASWSKKENKLVDSPPKILFSPIPILYVTAVTQSEKKQDGVRYMCPVYKIPRRTDLNYVFDVEVRTEDPPNKWILRGVSLLCSKD
eukprot:tig00021017_g17202.t1